MRVLRADDLSVGQIVTVHHYNLPAETILDDEGQVKTLTRVENSGKGEILEIVCIDLPYVLTRYHDKHQSLPDLVSDWDTRETVFASVSREYAERKSGKNLNKHFKEQHGEAI